MTVGYYVNVKNKETGKTVELSRKHKLYGSIYRAGGTPEAELSITYNYAKHFYKVWPKTGTLDEDETTPFGQMFAGNSGGIRSLYGKPLDAVIPELERAIGELADDATDDYWESTEGNARQALFDLKQLCEMAKFENPGADLVLEGD